MTHALPPYPAYKESGIEWLGQIPSHWEVHSFRQIARATKGSQPQRLYLAHEAPAQAKPYLTMEYLRAPQGNPKFYCVPSNGDVVANAGDILLLWDGANAGEFLVAKEGVVSSTAALLHLAHHNTRYIYFALKQCEPLLRAFSTGMGIPHVDGRTLRQMPIPLPPLDEQAAIVRVLDFVDRRMRRYARAQQQTIRLLTEYKQALIHHAVTGKVNVCTGAPYPTYRDTGIEWLGQIPSHWEVRRIGSLARILNGATPPTSIQEFWDGEIVWITPEDIGKLHGRYIDDSSRRITQEGYRACGTQLAPPGSIALSTRAPIGHLGILRVAACVNQGCRLIVPDTAVVSEFLYYYLVATRAHLESLGQGSTFTELSRTSLKSFSVPLPPLAEQGAIVEYLDAQTARIDAAIAAIRRTVALLGEYRERLVADVVTGKVDVRAVAAGLPEADDAADAGEADTLLEPFAPDDAPTLEEALQDATDGHE